MHQTSFNPTLEFAQLLDSQDSLSPFKEEFYLNEGMIYLDGNSLGLLSKRAEQSLLESLNDWKQLAIDGWMSGTHPWFTLAERLGAMTAPLIGALPEETIVTGSITTNIHQLVSTFYKPMGKRTKILADSLTFPSDIYALQSQLKLHGYSPEEHLVLVPSRDGRLIEEDDIIDAMTDEVALVLLPSVLYRSGQLLDIKRLASAAQEKGIILGIDAAHSIGAIPHQFHDWGVDFAVWCNYKYLNSGPGGVGGLFVHNKHAGIMPGLAGWFSSKKEKQFDMEYTLDPAPTAGALQIGTPHILSMAPLIGSLQIFEEASIEKIRLKSLQLTEYFMNLIELELSDYGFTIANPREGERRGGHVSLEHEEAIRICKSLKENKIIPDFRAPNIIRLAPIALYTSFADVWEAVQRIKKIMSEKQYEKFENKRETVA
ncbi:kynureninase [Ammoniphilus sp. CFH 90114]|uniref:kynureninase n=1 Tax=Ammoniphilus sp. CFH 90114 TaxID=2493665 RepID=UPI00100E7D67|nr:kynureninase [Ammoniphilus sp. CFH 90114]RXT13489.1 kynureninase [Ammoniphilus sp. CFH 90114]